MAIKGERSLSQLSRMANLCLRLKADLEGNTISSPTPPPTPPTLQQEHTIDTDNTDEANRYQRGVNFHQILRVTPAEAGHPRDSLAANAESSTINSLGAGSAQTDCRLSHPTCRAGSLVLTKAAGTGLSGGPGAETDNISGGQGREGASQNARCVTPGQELRTGSNNTGNISY
jgi:hypothetical protein